MSQLQRGHTYNPGDVVDAADLNSLVDAATGLGGLVFDQPAATPIATDSIVFFDASAPAPDRLRRCSITTLGTIISAVTEVSATATPTSVFGVTVTVPVAGEKRINLTLDSKNLNQVLAAPSDGSLGQPEFRQLVPKDTASMVVVSTYDIDLDLGNTFWKVLPDTAGARTFKLKNGTSGQTIRVIVQQGAGPGTNTVAWDTFVPADVIRWPHGTHPGMTTGASATDIYQFTLLQVPVGTGVRNYYGTFNLEFLV